MISGLRYKLLGLLAAGALSAQTNLQPLMEQYNKAWQLEGQRRPDEAIPLLKAIIAKDSTFYRAYQTLVEAYAQKKQLDKAEEYFRALAEQEPSNGLAHYGLAQIYNRRSLAAPAGEEFATCAEKAPKAHICYLGMVKSWVSANPFELQRHVPKDPHNPYRYLTLATVYQHQRKFPEALEAVRTGLESARTQNDLELQAVFHRQQSDISSFASEGFTDALSHSLQALRIAEDLSDWQGELETANTVAGLYQRLGETDQALTFFQRYLSMARKLGHRRLEFVYLSTLGGYYAACGDNEAALGAYKESQRLLDAYALESTGAPMGLIIGSIYRRMGRLSEALQCFQEAHRNIIAGEDKANEPYVLRSMGVLYAEMGDYVKALRYQTESVRLFRERRMGWQAGAGVGNIASIYEDLGAYARAKVYYEESLESARRNQDAGEEQRLLGELGALYLRLGQPKQALTCLTQARAMSDRVRYEPFKATILLNTGDAHMRLGQYSKALESITASLNVARSLGSKPLEAESLATLGDCFLLTGDLASAERNFSDSLTLGDQSGLAQIEVAAHRGLAAVYRKKHAGLQAFGHLQSAIEAIESQRNRVPTPELRASFLERNWKVYGDVVDVLSSLHEEDRIKGYDRLAFDYAERGRARSFLDTLAEARAHITTGLTAEEANLQTTLLSEISKASATLLRESSHANRQALAQAERNLADWATQLRSTNQRYQEFQYPQPSSIEKIQSSITAQGTAVLEYALGANRSHLWVITRSRAVMVTLPGRSAIEKAVTAYRSAISHHPRGKSAFESYLHHSSQVYRFLLEPARKYLAMERKLAIVPDGILYYVPFETLVRNDAASPR